MACSGSRGRPVALAFALVCAARVALAQAPEVRAELGAPSVPVGQSVSLNVEAFDVDGELDVSDLEAVFDVAVRSRSSGLTVTNGRREIVRSFVLELTPLAVGIFTVPPVRVGSVESELLTLEVTEPPSGAERDLFLEATVDVPDPWVQAQSILTLRGWFGVRVQDYAFDLPGIDDLVVEPLDDGRTFELTRDGRDYAVLERRYALFPQASGPMVVAPSLVAVVPADPTRSRGLLSPTRRAVHPAPPVTLDVRPRPPGGAPWWLPATDVTLEAEWLDDAQPRVGEPLTRAITLRAQGVRAEQLPGLPDAKADGASIHTDAPESGAAATDAGLVAGRRFVQAIIPRGAGPLELPAVEIEWFDTAAGTARTATLPARTLEVAPSARTAARTAAGPSGAVGPRQEGEGPGGAIDPDAVAPVALPDALDAASADEVGALPADTLARLEAGRRWRVAAVAAALGWLATVAALVVSRRRRGARDAAVPAGIASDASFARLRAELSREVARGAPDGLAHAALALASARRPDDPPRGLTALAERLDDGELRRALVALDARLYGSGGPGPDLPPRFAERLDAALAVDEGAGEALRGRRRGSRHGPAGSLPPL